MYVKICIGNSSLYSLVAGLFILDDFKRDEARVLDIGSRTDVRRCDIVSHSIPLIKKAE